MHKKAITNTLGIVLFIYWVTLLILTSTPAQELPKVDISDKVVHFGAYFVLAILFQLYVFISKGESVFNGKIKTYVLTIIVLTLYGAFDEIHQAFIPGRVADLVDFIADTLGVVTAVLLLTALLKQEAVAKFTKKLK